MSARFAEACHMPPFSNGTEGYAWTDKWCGYCRFDHAIHAETYEGGCDIMLAAFVGSFSLPSRMVCLAFEPCVEGDCTGDPGADDRAERVATVIDYWKVNR